MRTTCAIHIAGLPVETVYLGETNKLWTVATSYTEDRNPTSLIKTTSAAQSKSQVVVNQTFSMSRIPISVSLLTLIAGKFTNCHGKKPQIDGPRFEPSKPGKPHPHICKTCVRPFARLEHLQRHERSHTKEKPFMCQTCMRRFARKDPMLRHKRKLHVNSPTPPRLGSDSTESTTPPLIICKRLCERFIDYDVNSALSEKLTRDVALDADIVRYINSSNSSLTKVADSYSSFCTVERLKHPTRYSHINSASSAWSPVCPDGSQTLTKTDTWASFSSLYEDDEQTAYDSNISNSLAKPQAIDRVTGSSPGNLFDDGTEANTPKLYSDGNASTCENASTLQSRALERMQPGFDEHDVCRLTAEPKSRRPYEHGGIACSDTNTSTWNDWPCLWEALLEQNSSQASLLQAQPSCLHPHGLAASVHAVLPNQPNDPKKCYGLLLRRNHGATRYPIGLPTDNLPNATRSKAEGLKPA
jgi:hypothetical protein